MTSIGYCITKYKKNKTFGIDLAMFVHPQSTPEAIMEIFNIKSWVLIWMARHEIGSNVDHIYHE